MFISITGLPNLRRQNSFIVSVFSRLDFGYVPALRNRMRGNGGFRNGDGDLRGRDGKVPNKTPKGFSYPLRLVGDPVTPPPDSRRPRRKRSNKQQVPPVNGAERSKSVSGSVVKDSQTLARGPEKQADMALSLAVELGIDDSITDLATR